MKKIITLLLALAGMVSTASADWYVTGDATIVNGAAWNGTSTATNKMKLVSGTTYVLAVENKSITKNIDYYFKITDGTNEYPSSAYDGSYKINLTESATYTIVFYFDSSSHNIRVIVTPMLRWDLGNNGSGNWSWAYEESSMFTKSGDCTWTYELSPAKFTKDTSFRIYSSLFGKSAYPSGQDLIVTYGDDVIPSAYFNDGSTSWSWKLEKPNYTFEKVIITAVYKPFDTTNSADYGQWDVSADCYISKTVENDNVYATLGCSDALDLSGLAAEGITAYPLTANISTGKITKGTPITTVLAAGKGVLLENAAGKDVILSIPVSAETGVSADNDMVATTGTHVDQVANDGYTNYILAKQSGIVGFYKVNTSLGNDMQANTAYLKVADPSDPTLARAFYVFDDDITAINAMNQETTTDAQYFNLAGQRVAHPTKGLFIVNGKKLIMK